MRWVISEIYRSNEEIDALIIRTSCKEHTVLEWEQIFCSCSFNNSWSSVTVCVKLAAPEDDPLEVETCSACYINK
jgi:hypothetical protein